MLKYRYIVKIALYIFALVTNKKRHGYVHGYVQVHVEALHYDSALPSKNEQSLQFKFG